MVDRIEAVAPLLDAAFEFEAHGGVGERLRGRGLPAFAEAWREWMRPFETFRTEVEGFIDVDGDRVLVLIRDHVRPRETAISQENVEMIRAAVDAWNRGDWDESLKDTASDFVLDNSTNIGEWRGVHRGPEEVKRAWQAFTEAWQSVRPDISEFIEAGEGVVVTRQRAQFVGRDGIELPGPARSGWIWKIRDGQIVYVATFNDLDEALEAAGVSE